MMDRSDDSFDWSDYDWIAVGNEIDEKKVLMTDGEELDSLPRDMFVEYIRYLHDEKPELYHIMLKMYEAKMNGDIEELEIWKKLWDSYGKTENVGI